MKDVTDLINFQIPESCSTRQYDRFSHEQDKTRTKRKAVKAISGLGVELDW